MILTTPETTYRVLCTLQIHPTDRSLDRYVVRDQRYQGKSWILVQDAERLIDAGKWGRKLECDEVAA